MKIAPLLLVVVLLAGAVWLLLGDGSDDRPGGLDSADYIGGGDGGGPGLSADGREPDDGMTASTGARDPAAAAGTTSAKPLRVVGRVVDERRAPVAGADVTLRAGTRALGRAGTNSEGRYVLELPAGVRRGGVRIALLARTNDQRAGMVSAWLGAAGGSEQTMPVIVLAASHDLVVQVVREGSGVMGAQVCAVQRTGGVPHVLGTENGDEDGRVTLRGLPASALELFATAPGHGRGHLTLRLPRPKDAVPALIELQGERVLSVYVTDADTKRPVRGAEILVGDTRTMPVPHGPGYLPALPPVRTDRSGYAVIRRLAATETIYVNARASGYAFSPWWQAKTQTAAPNSSEVQVVLSRRRRVRFPVVEETVPTPADGTVLRVDSRTADRDTGGAGLSAVVEDGDVIVEGLGRSAAMGTVIAPSGAQATFVAAAGLSEGRTITFRMPRTVTVRVIERGGNPVAELPLRLDAGGRAPAVEPVITDAEGMAVFTEVPGDRATLYREVAGRRSRGGALATLDLTTELDVHEVVLEPAFDVVLSLRIDGEPRLPPDYSIMVDGQRFEGSRVEEDPDAGELRLRLRPPQAEGTLRLQLYPRGFLTETLELDARDAGARETFDLRPAGRLLVRVTPPDDGSYTLQLQRFDAVREAWSPAQIPTRRSGIGAGVAVRDPDGTHVYEGLEPGRFRVFERGTRRPSGDIEVQTGGVHELDFDLSGAQWIEGRVVGPVGANLVQARIVVDGREPRTGLWSGVRPDAEGTFRIRASLDRDVTLRVTHPTLMPAANGGRVTVRPGTDRVVLRLEPGPELRFRVAGYEDAQTPATGLWHAPLSVHLLPEKSGRALTVRPVAEAGTFRAGGFQPGTYTLWLIFGRGRAPYVRKGLVLGSQTLDLGTLEPPAGTTLRIRVAGLADRPNAAVWAVVTHEGEPAYSRHGALDREAGELVSRGLGAGRFRVLVRGAGLAGLSSAARVLLDRVITTDGSADVTLDVQLP